MSELDNRKNAVVVTNSDGSDIVERVADNVTNTAYATNLVVCVGPGTLYGLTGYNSKASAQFILVHDSPILPADTSVPKVVMTIPASSNFSLDYGLRGRRFLKGITISNSSTGPTQTVGSADIWVDARVKKG